MSAIVGLTRLIRPGTTVSGMGVALLGGYVASNADPNWLRLMFAVLSVGSILGSANTINDVFDARIDLVNKSWRPIPSGLVSRCNATYFSIVLAGIGWVIAWYLGSTPIILAGIAVVTSFAYAAFLQRVVFVKNVTVAGITSLAVIYGAVSVGYVPSTVYILAFIIFWCIMARETLKDMADLEGDVIERRQTLALLFGAKTTKCAISVYLAITIGGLLYSIGSFGPAYKMIIGYIAVPGIILLAFVILRSQRSEQFENLSRFLKFAFLLWFVALLLGV